MVIKGKAINVSDSVLDKVNETAGEFIFFTLLDDKNNIHLV